MQVKQLETFISIAENLSFSKVADKLYISQPAVTKQIKSLEDELGIKLFERTNKSVVLTPAGENYYQNIFPIVQKLKEAAIEAKNIATNSQPPIHIGYIGTIYENVLPPILKKFYQKYPLARFTYTNGSFSLFENIDNKKLDLVFGIDITIAQNNQWTFIPLCENQFYFILSKNNPLKAEKILSFSEFNGQTFICPKKEGRNNQNIIWEIFKMNCPDSKIIFSNSEDELLIKVSLNDGFGILPRISCIERKNINYVLAGLPVSSKFGISVRNLNCSDMIKDFVSISRQFFLELDIMNS